MYAGKKEIPNLVKYAPQDHFTKLLSDEDVLTIGGVQIQITQNPGHTLGHISYHCCKLGFIFCGDFLFNMGCGRLLEGGPKEMWESVLCFSICPH